MRTRSLLDPLLVAVLLAACSAPGGGASPVPSASRGIAQPTPIGASSALEGRTWISTAIIGHELVTGTRLTLRFDGGELSASAGCNSMSGAYSIVGDRLRVDEMATTEMACQADLMAQDQWLAAFLPGATVSLDATGMTLAKEGITMVLVDQQTTNLPLEGTYWIVDGLVSGDTVSSVPARIKAIIRFVGGRVEVRAGCNQGSGAATIAGGKITFGPIALTKMACGGDAMTVEQRVLAVLEGVQPYSIAGGSLELGGSGKDRLTLYGGEPSVPSPDPGPT